MDRIILFEERKSISRFALVFVAIFLIGFCLYYLAKILQFGSFFIFETIPLLLFLVVGIVILFRKEMVEINFEKKEIKFFSHLLFFAFNKRILSYQKINYFFIRDLNTKAAGFTSDSYTIVPYYEISLICNENNKRISVARTQSKNSAIRMIENILELDELEFRDRTFENSFSFLENFKKPI